ncbi:hemolysin-III channel protein-like protein Izh2 [Podospora conica]|nr:hemolysin-III channel protein-like protein Izh2 [Schizothecium conicum]
MSSSTGQAQISDMQNRPHTASLWECLHSWTYLHNETGQFPDTPPPPPPSPLTPTVNIFSHLFGALLFFILPLYIFNTEIPPRYAVATLADKLVCSTYFLGVATCFTFSTIFHTFFHHSASTFSLGLKLDFQGVILLMWGANIPLIYYAFLCDPPLQVAYWCLTTTFALLCSVVTFQPRFSDPHLRPLRAATFGSLAMTTFIPVVHGLARYGWVVQAERIALRWIVATLVLNTVGAGAYAVKFPERWYPRRFDVFGASHQIMHVMILVAGGAYGMAVLGEFDYRHGNPGQCSG